MTGRSLYEPLRQVDLLARAALCPDDVARNAWNEWKGNFGLDAATWGEVRMLGSVANRIDRLEDDISIVPRVKGIRKFLWANTQQNLRSAQIALATLTAKGIPCLLLKGAARIAEDDRAAAERLIRDVDILVPYDRAIEAYDALIAIGWELNGWQTASRANGPRQSHHAWALKLGKAECDLHHFSNYLNRLVGDDDRLWARARVKQWRGLTVHLPDPTDGLIIALVHGLRASADNNADWVIDAAAILEKSAVDWHVFREEVAARMVEGLAAPGLKYLESLIGARTPPGLIDALDDRISPALHCEAQVYSQTDWPTDPIDTDHMFQMANLRASGARALTALAPSQRRTPSQTRHAKPSAQTLIKIDPLKGLMPDQPVTLSVFAQWQSKAPPATCQIVIEAPGIVFTKSTVDILAGEGSAQIAYGFRLSSGLLRRREVDRIWIKLLFDAPDAVPESILNFETYWTI